MTHLWEMRVEGDGRSKEHAQVGPTGEVTRKQSLPSLRTCSQREGPGWSGLSSEMRSSVQTTGNQESGTRRGASRMEQVAVPKTL